MKDALTRAKRKLAKWPENLQWITTDDKKKPKGSLDTALMKNDADELAFLQYTSGSTSEPKGVMITHGNLAHNLTIITRELQAYDDAICVSWLPQYHDMGLIGSYLGILYCGGSGFYMSPLSFLQRPMLWIEAVSKHKATHLQAPNFAFKLTARKFQASNYVNDPLNLSSVRHVINAAEPVDVESIEAFERSFGPFGLGKVVFPTYGLAEHTVFVCSGGKQIISVLKEKLEVDGEVVLSSNGAQSSSHMATVAGGTDTKGDTLSLLVGCGFPANQSVDVRIVNRETCQELPGGRVGEIWVRSPSKAAGYFRKGAETEEDFQAKINGNDLSYLRTGDLGFMHNNELFICGRLKDLIIVAGRNYYPQDIEATAEATSDQLRPGCSAAFSIDPTCEGGEDVALVMELREVPSQTEAATFCDKLANQVRAAINEEHSLGISQIVFLRTKTVPKTTSGKIARAWCRKGLLGGTLQVVFVKSYKDKKYSFEIEQNKKSTPLSREEINRLRQASKEEIFDKLRTDVARAGDIPPDTIDKNTALITILDSLSISQFKGELEAVYGVKISDEYLFGETTTLTKLVEIVKLGHAPDDLGGNGESEGIVASAPTGTAGGLAGLLGCPPGVVLCVIQ